MMNRLVLLKVRVWCKNYKQVKTNVYLKLLINDFSPIRNDIQWLYDVGYFVNLLLTVILNLKKDHD